MKTWMSLLTLAAGVAFAGSSFAQAPANATGLCKDGTYYTGATKQGACKGHKGVKDWYADKKATAAPATPAAKDAPVARDAPATPPAPAAMAPAKAGAPATKAASTSAPAAGGGPGQVWVNTASKVYHCSGTRWYGKTKQGEYMSEADAKAKGFQADHKKACS